MKIEVEIPDDEIIGLAKQIAAEKMAQNMVASTKYDARVYRNAIKEVIREVIRGDIENLSDRAVAAASKSIENKAVKKLLEKLEDDRK